MARVAGGELFYVTTDHIGTSWELISEDRQTVTWRADPGLWGKVANDDRSPCPIRFQGQWEDEESGLHYNRFRYYDPEATQYLSPDPIGLRGGVRPQGYVADANGWVDPLGLAACAIADNLGQLFAQVRQHTGTELTPHQMRAINQTLDNIRSGSGPYPRDGTPYDNSSQVDPTSAILQSGNYTEWTVQPWPGASQSGGMRIVRETNTGRRYFTPDHYQTFFELGPNY